MSVLVWQLSDAATMTAEGNLHTLHSFLLHFSDASTAQFPRFALHTDTRIVQHFGASLVNAQTSSQS